MDNTPTIELEVVDAQTVIQDMKEWLSKLQYLEKEELQQVIKMLDNHLKKSSEELNDMKQMANENIRNLSFKKYVKKVSNGK